MMAKDQCNDSTPSSEDSGASANSFDDVQYLLYLEALKRYREKEARIQMAVENKASEYKAVQSEYTHLFGIYTKLVELVGLRATIQRKNDLPQEKQILAALRSVAHIQTVMSNEQVTDSLNPDLVKAAKEKIAQCETHSQVKQLSQEMVQIKALVRDIQNSLQTTENMLETATVQGFDNFVNQLKLEESEQEED